jgi:hypothetical protein
MRKSLISIAAAALTLALMGGGALRASPPPNGGTISIETKTEDGNDDPAMHSFVDAVAEALTAKGFTVFDDPDHAASVVELLLSRGDAGTGFARVPGQRAPSLIGTGVAIPLSTGASEVVHLQRTRLEMRIRRRGETDIVWDGAAVTVREAGTREGSDQAVASALSQALLQSYPAAPKDVVGVP